MAGHTNHAQNAAAWAAMRANEAAASEKRRADRAAAKAARREANRAAWWARLGKAVPTYDRADVAPAPVEVEAVGIFDDDPVYNDDQSSADTLHVKGCKVDQVADTEWHIVTSDGTGYEIDGAGYTVTIGNETYTVPTLEDAQELIELAEETRREEADEAASFTPGMTVERYGATYTVEHVTANSVIVRVDSHGISRSHTLKMRRDERGQYVVPNARTKYSKAIYAADLAA